MARRTTDVFGQTVTSSGSSTSSYQFGATSGYRTDGDAGLGEVGCRYYDPEVGDSSVQNAQRQSRKEATSIGR